MSPEQKSGEPQLSTQRKILYSSLILMLSLVAIETTAQIVQRVAYGGRAPRAKRLHDYDPELGWVNMKDRRALDRYGPNKHATHNSLGLRATKEYTAAVQAGRYRIIFLGDSFTYGAAVGDADTFVAQLKSMAPSIEIVNMGVAGYGIDQMYLRYKR